MGGVFFENPLNSTSDLRQIRYTYTSDLIARDFIVAIWTSGRSVKPPSLS